MRLEWNCYQADEKKLIKDALDYYYGVKSDIHNINRKVENKPDYCKCIKTCKEVLRKTKDINITSFMYCLIAKAYNCLKYYYLSLKYAELSLKYARNEGIKLFAKRTLSESLILIPMLKNEAYIYFEENIKRCLESGNLKELIRLYLTRGEMLGIEQDLVIAVQICRDMYKDNLINYTMLHKAINCLNRYYKKYNVTSIEYYNYV